MPGVPRGHPKTNFKMKIALEQHDREFLDQLHRLGTGTVHEICAEIGVTATAIRQRLNRLQSLDLVAREMVRMGRGRPHYVYRVTETGLRLLGENYSDLAMILWRSMMGIEEPGLRREVVSRVRQALVERYGKVVQAESLRDRVRQLQGTLVERGFDVEVDQTGGLPILRENNCPYQELASSDSSICELEQEVFAEVLGTNVELTECRLDGHHCCEFRAGPTNAESAASVAGGSPSGAR